MTIRGKHKCYFCDREFGWAVTIKDENIETVAKTIDEEIGIPTFIDKNKLEIDINCPLCRNVNRFRIGIKPH
ncbi:MAG: hypothetical protein N3I35_04455 [Clostridia bacterium]|nr:hypothetical protein [Clostridia bacterium]